MAVFAAVAAPAAAVAVALVALWLADFICHIDEKGVNVLLVPLIVALLSCLLHFVFIVQWSCLTYYRLVLFLVLSAHLL